MRFILALGALATAAGFVVPAQHGRAPVTRRQGFLEDMMDKLDGGGKKPAKDDWKEKAYREQQAMLAERRKTGGGLSKEKELEIARRRSATVSDGDRKLRELQTRAGGKDVTEEWMRLRDSGEIKTAAKGLTRDKGSSRMGSEGLFEERVDEKLPYIDQGYVDEDADFFGKLFGKKKDKK